MARDAVSHEDLADRLDKGDGQFVSINEKLEAIATALEPLPQMQRDIAKTREIVETYETIKNLAKFVKWASGAVAGVLAIWVFLKAMALGLLQ